MTLRLLVVEGNTAEVRARQAAAGRLSTSAAYAEVLRGLMPEVLCAIAYPADVDAPLPGIAELTHYEGVVITGSALHAYDGDQPCVARQIDLARAVFAAGRPFFGSCWGMQIATVAAGGVVRVNPKGREIGFARDIRLTSAGRAHPLFHGKPDVFESPAVHLDEVGVLPPNATVLAGNDASAIQAIEIRHDHGVFWGVQYHPEYTMGDVAATIRRYGKLLTDEGLFASDADREAFADEIERMDDDHFDKRIAARHALGDTVLDPGCRRLEIQNWLERQVIPNRIA